MGIEWKDNEAGTEAEAKAGGISLFISRYDDRSSNAGQWYWSASEAAGERASGIVETRQEAAVIAADWAERGQEAIRQAAAAKLQEEIIYRVRKLAEIAPGMAEQMPSFQAGYRAGLEAARQALNHLVA